MRSTCRLSASVTSNTLPLLQKFQSPLRISNFIGGGNIFQSVQTVTSRNLFDPLTLSTRLFRTCHCRRATVESSFHNLDSLKHPSRTRIPSKFTEEPNSFGHFQEVARYIHTENIPLLRRLWHRRRRSQTAFGSEDQPSHNFFDERGGTSLARNKASKAANELRLRCTEINENGDVTLVHGEFKKAELIAKVFLVTQYYAYIADRENKYGLLPRDLRKIDSSLLPRILVRPSAIFINLLHLRVLIQSDRVLVLEAYGTKDSYAQSVFLYDLQGKLAQKESSRQAGSLPYEFRALEAVLISVTSGLETEFEGVSEPVVRVLRELEEDIDRDKLRHLLIYSKKLGTFEQKARLVRDAIDDLLDADDDLVLMYLTERAQGKEREEDDHTEVEMLLESYHKVCDEIVQVSSNLVSNIRNTEEM